jgi:hypothetical protein
MAIYKFADAICAGRPIDVYNHGKMRRSFTYIDDAVEAVMRIAAKAPLKRSDTSTWGTAPEENRAAPYRIYNLGNHQSIELEEVKWTPTFGPIRGFNNKSGSSPAMCYKRARILPTWPRRSTTHRRPRLRLVSIALWTGTCRIDPRPPPLSGTTHPLDEFGPRQAGASDPCYYPALFREMARSKFSVSSKP